ncbi:MAG: aspartate-semialdehyde dehydrogenase [Candidatus Krumholzibacteria bacterium]
MSAPGRRPVAVIGATGMVGQAMTQVLEERGFPVAEYVPVATEGSSGRKIDAFGRSWVIRGTAGLDFGGIGYCFFTAGAAVSRELIPSAVAKGCRVVDNTTAFRMDAGVPLVVPEINGRRVTPDTPLVSCPNCTTINLVMTLAPIAQLASLKRVVVTAFQSVSGAGRKALDELDHQIEADCKNQAPRTQTFDKPIAFNCIPQIGEITPSGYSAEEEKIIEETRKILEMPSLDVVPTSVRVPIRVGHALSVNVELAGAVELDDLKALWNRSDGLTYSDEPPTPLEVAGGDTVVVGRLRRDGTRPHAFSYWAVGDNLRKGAATNSVQIAELLLACESV